ncbi:hypothetical protein GCM10010409_31010 [Mycolicibacterium diernhoferi]
MQGTPILREEPEPEPEPRSVNKRVFEEDYQPYLGGESNAWQPGRSNPYFRWKS